MDYEGWLFEKKQKKKLTLDYFLADVLNEESILKWYNEEHLAKGKGMFLEQMKKFVEWLKSAEEGERALFSRAWL